MATTATPAPGQDRESSRTTTATIVESHTPDRGRSRKPRTQAWRNTMRGRIRMASPVASEGGATIRGMADPTPRSS